MSLLRNFMIFRGWWFIWGSPPLSWPHLPTKIGVFFSIPCLSKKKTGFAMCDLAQVRLRLYAWNQADTCSNPKGRFSSYPQFNGNFRIQLMEVRKRTICLAIFCWDIPWTIGLKNRPFFYGRYLQFRFLLHGHWPAFSQVTTGPKTSPGFGHEKAEVGTWSQAPTTRSARSYRDWRYPPFL